jgi:hypothetical protein
MSGTGWLVCNACGSELTLRKPDPVEAPERVWLACLSKGCGLDHILPAKIRRQK